MRAPHRVLFAALLFAALLVPSTARAQSIGDRLRRAARNVGDVARTLLPISTDKEIEIGRGIAATIAGRFPVSQDTQLTLYVNLVGLTVAGESPRTDIAYRFAVLETPQVNAFAAPGGYIFITRGALELIQNEAELAGVLAHEVAHVNRRHVIEQIRKADFMREVRDQAGLTGARLDRVVGQGSNVLFTGLSRGDEMEADSLGLELAASAGYDAGGLAGFVGRLETRREGPARELFATHPPPSVRLARLAALAQRINQRGGMVLEERYRLALGRVGNE
jgi:beta-barrel assembly-enhancing protease